MTLMFAYGSNLNLEQMERRCPAAEPIGRFRLPGWRLVFRNVADVVQEEGAFCHGGVWRITPACERALDVYEGVSSGLYRKEYIRLKRPTPQGEEDMLVYVMNSMGIMPPSQYYLSVIKQGYRDFGMPKAAHKMLAAAVTASWDDKHPTHVERRRHARKGRPALAGGPSQVVAP